MPGIIIKPGLHLLACLVTWNSRDGTWPFGSRIVAVGFQKIFKIIFRAGFRYIVRYTLLT